MDTAKMIKNQHYTWSTVVEWIERPRVDREVCGSNPALDNIFRLGFSAHTTEKSLAHSENEWMDARARTAVHARSQKDRID